MKLFLVLLTIVLICLSLLYKVVESKHLGKEGVTLSKRAQQAHAALPTSGGLASMITIGGIGGSGSSVIRLLPPLGVLVLAIMLVIFRLKKARKSALQYVGAAPYDAPLMLHGLP